MTLEKLIKLLQEASVEIKNPTSIVFADEESETYLPVRKVLYNVDTKSIELRR